MKAIYQFNYLDQKKTKKGNKKNFQIKDQVKYPSIQLGGHDTHPESLRIPSSIT